MLARVRSAIAGRRRATKIALLLVVGVAAGAAIAGAGPGGAEDDTGRTTPPTVDAPAASASDDRDSTTTTEPLVAAPPTTAATAPLTVVHVTDGDTLDLSDGRTVRLAQVDAPETGECFGAESTAALIALAAGNAVELRRPPDAPATDQYGRTLAEVIIGSASVNERLIRDGAAEFNEEFAHEDADLAQRLQAAEIDAALSGRGLWSACAAAAALVAPPPLPPATVVAPPPPPPSGGGCDAAYPDVCLPPAPPDLDCGDVAHRRFRVVVHPDPHGFDGDNDGVGCES